MKVLVIIPMKVGDYNPLSMRSILEQTIKPAKIHVHVNEGKVGVTLAEKVSYVMNEAFALFNLAEYDYILRVDADTYLPSNFIEENLKDSPDLCATGGCAMLIRTAPFLQLMNGRLPSQEDDSYIPYKFQMHGLKVTHPRVSPVLLRDSGHLSFKYFWHRGQGMYRLGYEPIHVLHSLMWPQDTFKHSISVVAYTVSFLLQRKRHDVAVWVFITQLHNLTRGLRPRRK